MRQTIEQLVDQYPALEDVFQLLPEDVKKHLRRVAEYSKILFTAAVELELAPYDENSENLIKADYANDAYMAGLYHDIGLVLLSDEAQDRKLRVQPEYLDEYRTHPVLSVEVLEHYRDESISDNVWKMILEAVHYHHENRDGSGYPAHLDYSTIPFMATVVAIANDLDNESAYVHLEDAFGNGYNKMREKLKDYSLAEYDLMLVVAESRLQKAFLSHREETFMVVTPPQMIFHRANRPLKLKYRRICARKNGQTSCLQLAPSFYDVDSREDVSWGEMEETLQEEGVLFNTWRYFLYETGDMLRRLSAYGLEKIFLMLPVSTEILRDKKFIPTLKRWKEETQAATSHIELLMNAGTAVYLENDDPNTIDDLVDLGFRFGLDEYTGKIPYEYLGMDIKFYHVLLDPSVLDHLDADMNARLQSVLQENAWLIADGIEGDEFNEQLDEIGVTHMCGNAVGTFVNENEILAECNTQVYR